MRNKKNPEKVGKNKRSQKIKKYSVRFYISTSVTMRVSDALPTCFGLSGRSFTKQIK
jgi:hypothetical protein